MDSRSRSFESTNGHDLDFQRSGLSPRLLQMVYSTCSLEVVRPSSEMNLIFISLLEIEIPKCLHNKRGTSHLPFLSCARHRIAGHVAT